MNHCENATKIREAILLRENIAVVYDVDVVSSIPMLEMDKVETSLSSLLGDVGGRWLPCEKE